MDQQQKKRLTNSKRWIVGRERWLESHPLCVMCLHHGKVVAGTVVDHKIRHQGDPELFYDQDNWQSLCKRHHDGWKQALDKSGVARGCDLDGLPIDPNHHWNKL